MDVRARSVRLPNLLLKYSIAHQYKVLVQIEASENIEQRLDSPPRRQ